MQNGINKIIVLGDSILKGVVTGTASGNLFDVIEDSSLILAQKKLGFEMENQSVFGSIVTKGQRKLNKVLEKGQAFDLGIIEFGGNDSDYDWAPVSENPDTEHLPRTPLEDYLRITDEMVKAMRDHKITPLIMTMPPLVPDRWFEHISRELNRENILKFLKGNPHKPYENHERYNINLVKYAQENKVQTVDMRLAMLSAPDYRELMCKDGIHPNEQGYAYMAEIWCKALPELKKEF